MMTNRNRIEAKHVVVIDEVQKLPEILDEVHPRDRSFA